jgi:hypothetical protein
MIEQPLIARPRYSIEGVHKYRLQPREKRSFHTALDAADIIEKHGATSEVRIEAGTTGDVTLHFQHSLIHGTIRESLVLKDTPAGLKSGHLKRTVHGTDDTLVRSEDVFFHSGTLPLPGPTYPEVILPFLLSWQPFDKTQRTLYAWINDRFVAKVQYESVGRTTLTLNGTKREAWEMVMWPDLNDWISLGRVLTKLSYPFVPKYRMWFDVTEPHTVLRYEGPYGPPGAPEIVLELVDG